MARARKSRAAIEGRIKEWEADCEVVRKHVEEIERHRSEPGCNALNGVRLVPIERVGHALGVAQILIDYCSGVDGVAVSDLACLIDNDGDEVDRAEAFLALVPIAERVYEKKADKKS